MWLVLETITLPAMIPWQGPIGRKLLLAVVSGLLLLSACTSRPSPGPSSSRISTSTLLATRGPAVAGSCVKGWNTPVQSSPLYDFPINLIERATRVDGPFHVVDMRYFNGPESRPSEAGYLLNVGRWYVKISSQRDPTFQGRFLVERRQFGSGVSAVAPYDTEGWKSSDWSGFQWDSTDSTPKVYKGLPGEWAGIRYPFVQGGKGLNLPGLPAAVVGCLDGT